MPESRLDRKEQRHPELNHFQESRMSFSSRTTTGLNNHFLRKYSNEADSSPQIQNQKMQHPILNLYSGIKQIRKDLKSHSRSSRMFSLSSIKGFKKDLGHELDQLTKGNQHEANLSPHPSLTIMVQPNKIDYSERSIASLPFAHIFVNLVNLCFSTA